MKMVDVKKKIKRKTLFIESSTGTIYLPRPNNWMSGWLRHLWFKNKMGKIPHIISPNFWDILAGRHKVKILVQYDNGQYEVLEET